jgi:hypothetical protein
MQYSPEYLAYLKMLTRRRGLWVMLIVGMPALMFGLVFLSGGIGALVTFPALLLAFFVWKYAWSQNDMCPWCRKSFSEGWYGGGGGKSPSGELRCANCGRP